MKRFVFMMVLVISSPAFAEFGTYIADCVEENSHSFTPIKAQFEIVSGSLWSGDRYISNVAALENISIDLPNENGIKLKCTVKKKEMMKIKSKMDQDCCPLWRPCEGDLPFCKPGQRPNPTPAPPKPECEEPTRPRPRPDGRLCRWGDPDCFPVPVK